MWLRLEGPANSAKRIRLVEILKACLKDKKVRLPAVAGRGGAGRCESSGVCRSILTRVVVPGRSILWSRAAVSFPGPWSQAAAS